MKEKLKLHFSRIVLILGWFWYLYIAAKISSPFSGVWQSKLLGTLRAKLGTKFWKYLLKVSAISKSSVSRLPFSVRDIFSKLFDWLEKKLFIVFQNCLLSTTSFTFRFEYYSFLVFLNKLTRLFLYLLYAFLSLSDLLFRNFILSFDLTITPR